MTNTKVLKYFWVIKQVMINKQDYILNQNQIMLHKMTIKKEMMKVLSLKELLNGMKKVTKNQKRNKNHYLM